MRQIFVVIAMIAAPCAVHADTPPIAEKSTTIMVPYRLTKTQHVLVRAKINGKGPYNFILDTGAPALFVSKKVGETIGVKPDRRGWGTFDRFEIEGGVVLEKAKGKIDDLFQLDGMNNLGLAGVELHGVIGYNQLARYRIEYDFTKPKLTWTKLNFEPPSIGSIGGKSAPAGLEMIGSMAKFLGALIGLQANFAVQPRGFLGAELNGDGNGVSVVRVLENGPAAKAGLKAGDVIRKISGVEMKSAKDVATKLGEQPEGTKLEFTILRDGKDQRLTIELGRGL